MVHFLNAHFLNSLISMSMVARSYGFVRPEIVPADQKIQIVKGRHPLVEIMCDFVPNSTSFERGENVKILTGPNASGKSIYLKQVCHSCILIS
jgi:DNA mismatch repair ATPase MutS